MDIKTVAQSKTFKVTIIVLGVFLVALVSFASGVAVGLHKAKFSYAFGENYERNFMGGDRDDVMGGGRMPFFPPRNSDGKGFRNGHGIVGEIISLSDDSLVVKDPSGKEDMVSLSAGTQVRGSGDNMSIADLRVGNRIAVIGKPGDTGTVSADFIRVLEINGN